jgi:ABC-type lipopolysaccharide export system ATPase subunit
MNVKSGDCVGIVTPNGPEAATIFISIASFATAAPLNPNYTKDEFKF